MVSPPMIRIGVGEADPVVAEQGPHDDEPDEEQEQDADDDARRRRGPRRARARASAVVDPAPSGRRAAVGRRGSRSVADITAP